MSTIVKGYSKQTKTTYIYEQDYTWNPEKGRSEGTRKLIGKIDPVTGEMIPTGKPGRPKKKPSPPEEGNQVPLTNPYEAEMKVLLQRNKELTDEIADLKKSLRESEKKLSSMIKAVNSAVRQLNALTDVTE